VGYYDNNIDCDSDHRKGTAERDVLDSRRWKWVNGDSPVLDKLFRFSISLILVV
jgi:hypothetical protein